MSKLLLTFYGDDFTGSTDALEQLTLAGIRTVLFIAPPTQVQLKQFPGLQAVGVAGKTRSLAPAAMERELKPALKKLEALGARHVHYKVCSTFDSSPAIGSIGRAIDIGAQIFKGPFVPVLAAAPALGRYTIFGTHFARYGIGSAGQIHRLDRHPSISKHPVTPMTEADLRVHLAKQTKKNIGLFDILNHSLSKKDARRALGKLIAQKHKIILFDALTAGHIARIGELLEDSASGKTPFFSVGSSGIETALASQHIARGSRGKAAQTSIPPARQVLIGSGSCSPVTSAQIAWALRHGFAEVPIDAEALCDPSNAATEITRASAQAIRLLRTHRKVIVHTTRSGSNRRIVNQLGNRTAEVLGRGLGQILRLTMEQAAVSRLCIAGGDTSSHAAMELGIEALEMIAPLTPGAPLCQAHVPHSTIEGCEVVFKGGQVGPENYFEIVLKGKP